VKVKCYQNLIISYYNVYAYFCSVVFQFFHGQTLIRTNATKSNTLDRVNLVSDAWATRYDSAIAAAKCDVHWIVLSCSCIAE